MDSTTILGLVAGALSTVSFLPQVVKTWRSKSAKDVSLFMFLLLASGMVLWLIYGLLIKSLPVILANVVSLSLSLVILALKIKYNHQ